VNRKTGPTSCDVAGFPDEAGRQAHLGGQVAAALMESAPELLASEPSIETVDVLAESCRARRARPLSLDGVRYANVRGNWTGRAEPADVMAVLRGSR
jgi:hypothetical protein